jgi:hypothetical protein
MLPDETPSGGGQRLKRYFYYLIFVNMLVNVVAYVPRLLIRDRFHGSIMAVPIAVLIGGGMMLIFSRLMRHFPEQDLAQIYKSVYPGWLAKSMLLLIVIVWLTAGMFQLLVYSEFTLRFINPDIPEKILYLLFGSVVLYAARNKTESILYQLEITLVLSTPLIGFILIKALVNESMRWDSVFTVLQAYGKAPQISSIAATSYLFSGYANLVVFNRVFPSLPIKWLWLMIPLGFLITGSSFLIPIGYLGADGVSDYVFAWMSASDSMRVEFGFIERVMFIFYGLYGLITFVSMIIHWHVALELGKSVFFKGKAGRKQDYIMIGSLVVLLIVLVYGWGGSLSDNRTFHFGEMWLNIRLGLELLLLLTIWIAARRKRA